VERFKEKPDAATAAAFLAEGGWYWNSGMFVWKASAIMKAVESALPDLAGLMKLIGGAFANALPNQEALREHFPKCESVSIDHGVLEKAKNLYLVPANIGWSDVGQRDRDA
jgi:mannose-1-phosphate guanylyltransferase